MSIYEKLIKVQAELKAPKNQYNSFGRYNYRNCEDILEAVKPLLLKNGLTLTITDSIEGIDGRYYVKAQCHLIDIENGESISVNALAREAETKKGMDDSQVTGATSSYARKYALNGLFLIDDTKDHDFSPGADDDKKAEPSKTLSDAQIQRLYAISTANGYSREEVKKGIYKYYKKQSAKELSKAEYDDMVNKLQATKETR